MKFKGLLIFTCSLVLIASLHPGKTAPVSESTVVTKLQTLLNSFKASLPNAAGAPPGGGDKSAEDKGKDEKKGNQPTSFQMDDRSPEIEVKTSAAGMNIKTRPASLQVLSTPMHPLHIHDEIDHHIISAPPHFMPPPEIVHPVAPVFYGGGAPRGYSHYHHHHLSRFHMMRRPYAYFPYRYFYAPYHHVHLRRLNAVDDQDDSDDNGSDDDSNDGEEENDYGDYNDDYEGGDKKEKIPIKKKHDHTMRRVKVRKKHGKKRRQ